MINSADEFVRLRTSEVMEEYSQAAHDEASLSVWQEVLGKYPEMAFWVAQNKTVPYEVLEQLASHEDDRVRSMVSMKNKLKESLLLKLANDSNDSVRMSIARHKKATPAVLKLLTNDSWPEVSKVAIERIESGNYK